MKNFEPMKAAQCDDIAKLRFPLIATPKIDGIRCLVVNGVAVSRTMKPIRNRFIQSLIGKEEFNGLDGELVVGDNFQDSTSGIMSADGEPDFRYMVFDRWDHQYVAYQTRVGMLDNVYVRESDHIQILEPYLIESHDDLTEYYDLCLTQGHEGVMVRDPMGGYKYGRSTFKEGWLIKLKPFVDDEAVVVGFTEQMHNANAAELDAFGRTKRSSHKANQVGKNTLGTLIVEHKTFGRFELGTGFNDALRAKVWGAPEKYLGELAKFRYQAIGIKDKPRIPVFLGFRDLDDL
jgi:DNA ligase-1